MKGRIVAIHQHDFYIQFSIEIDKVINELDAEDFDFNLIGISDNGNSVISFNVAKTISTDEDEDLSPEAIIPFQVAYAVSIHKAQGLEYKTVKIVITAEIDELITHNIFYTAITRAKEKLKIYWSPETEQKVLNNIELRRNDRDVALLSVKFAY